MGLHEVPFELNQLPAGDGCDINAKSFSGHGFDPCEQVSTVPIAGSCVVTLDML